MSDRIEMKATVDAFDLLDSLVDGLGCQTQVLVKHPRKRVKELRGCLEQGIPVEQRCPHCKAVWYLRRAIDALEAPAPAPRSK